MKNLFNSSCHDLVFIDYPERLTYHKVTEESQKNIDLLGACLKDLTDKYNIHININNYIYIPIHKIGISIDKRLRIKVDGNVYNKIMKSCNNILPRYIELLDAEKLDINEIY